MGKIRTYSGVILTAVGALALVLAAALAGLGTAFRGFGMEIGIEEFWRRDPGFARVFLAYLFRFPFPGPVTLASLIALGSGILLLTRRREPKKREREV